MSKRSVAFLLADIQDAIEKIERYIHGITAEKFTLDSKTVDAVVRNLEIIGEAQIDSPKTLQISTLILNGEK